MGGSATGWAAAEGVSGRGQIWVAGGAGWAAAWAMPPCGARGGLHRPATQGWAGVMASKTQARQVGRDRDISTSRSRTRSSPFAPLISKGANVSSRGGPWGGAMQPPWHQPQPYQQGCYGFPSDFLLQTQHRIATSGQGIPLLLFNNPTLLFASPSSTGSDSAPRTRQAGAG